jgi:hypothetical protein
MTAKLCIRLPDIAGDLTVIPQCHGLDCTHSHVLRREEDDQRYGCKGCLRQQTLECVGVRVCGGSTCGTLFRWTRFGSALLLFGVDVRGHAVEKLRTVDFKRFARVRKRRVLVIVSCARDCFGGAELWDNNITTLNLFR